MIASNTLKVVLKKWNASLLQSAQEMLTSSNIWYFPMVKELAASENAATAEEEEEGGGKEDDNEGRVDKMEARKRRAHVMAVEKLADLLGPIETRKALVSASINTTTTLLGI